MRGSHLTAYAGKILKEFARLAEIEDRLIVSQLTSREKEVLQKINEGLSNREIELSLCISEHTVKADITSISKKLRLRIRSQAVDYARRWGLN